MPRTTKAQSKVGETRLEYMSEHTQANSTMAYTKLSSKNQVTLPVAYVRQLGLRAGDELVVWLDEGHITLERRLHGKDLLDSLQGSIKSDAWGSKEKIDKWVSDLRDEWERG